jgi:hypothetical protein
MPSSTLRAEIPLTDLRAAFGRSSMSLSAVARAAGYDQAYVARMLADRVTYYYRTLSNGERRRYRIQRHSATPAPPGREPDTAGARGEGAAPDPAGQLLDVRRLGCGARQAPALLGLRRDGLACVIQTRYRVLRDGRTAYARITNPHDPGRVRPRGAGGAGQGAKGGRARTAPCPRRRPPAAARRRTRRPAHVLPLPPRLRTRLPSYVPESALPIV